MNGIVHVIQQRGTNVSEPYYCGIELFSSCMCVLEGNLVVHKKNTPERFVSFKDFGLKMSS